MLCRAANSRYEVERSRARQNGDYNGVVDAAPAREHLSELSKLGVGRHAVAAASDVPESSLYAIIKGEQTRISARNLRRILAVTTEARADRSIVPAGPTWRLIHQLLEGGYTRQQIARWLGSTAKNPALQLRRDRITAANASKVERLYKRIQEGRVSR